MQVGEFTLQNPEKVERAINGTVGAGGQLKGGVGPEDPKAVLAEYDRLGGHITKGTHKVKPGSFFDFKTQKPIANPKPKLVFRIEGEDVEVDADEPLPLQVRASEAAKTKKQEKAEAAAAKKAAKSSEKQARDDAKKKPVAGEATDADAEEEEGELA